MRISTPIVKISGGLLFPPPNLNAERDAPNFLRKASLGLKLCFSFMQAKYERKNLWTRKVFKNSAQDIRSGRDSYCKQGIVLTIILSSVF